MTLTDSTSRGPEVRIAGGSCLCGQIRYEIRGRVGAITVCHCSQCRKFHGAAAPYAPVRREKVVVAGDATLSWFESSPTVRRGFCSTCGSSLFWDHRESPFLEIAMGTVDGPTGLSTSAHIWVDSHADWEHLEDGLPRHAQSPPKP